MGAPDISKSNFNSDNNKKAEGNSSFRVANKDTNEKSYLTLQELTPTPPFYTWWFSNIAHIKENVEISLPK